MESMEKAGGKGGSAASSFSQSTETIGLFGVETNNLKGLDIRFPLGEFTVVTGVSGSGKSSLVFDTLYAESYRRYVESLSSFARQYLKAIPKPRIREVRNLPPAIAVKQARAGLTNRSTVGTLTELFDILRILYTHLSEVVCARCGETIRRESGETLARRLAAAEGERVTILAPLSQWGKMKAADLRAQLEAQGFGRVLVDGQIMKIDECNLKTLSQSDVVIDRTTINPENMSRLVDSLNLAFKVGRGVMAVVKGDDPRRSYSNQMRCQPCGIDYREPSSALFNFNHPLGACEVCQGFGQSLALDEDKVIPDRSLSLAKKGVAPWNFGQHEAYYNVALKSASAEKIDKNKPFAEYSPREWSWLFDGDAKGSFPGVKGYFAWLDSKKYKPHYRIHAARFRRYVTCPQCAGQRLNQFGLACRIQGENMAQVAGKAVKDLQRWLQDLMAAADRLSHSAQGHHGTHSFGVREALDEGLARVGYMMKIGLGYLTLNRSAKTLSGGELQRINMASCLGSALTDTLFCLDEPSSGLHARDSRNLLEVIQELKHLGNTVVVVEHEKTIIEGADRLMEIGPEAGHRGGHLVFEGNPRQRLQAIEPDWAGMRTAFDKMPEEFIELAGARTHNLKNINVRFPIGRLTAVCGVSGSGKTSLIEYTLFPLLQSALRIERDRLPQEPVADGVGPVRTIQKHHQVILVSQEGIGRSTRSNIATYLNVLGDIRKVLAAQPLAKSQDLTASHFSFNRPGGRCETCEGLGTVVEDLSFLGEMAVVCPVCEGRRFADEVLHVRYKNLNLLDILNLTVTQAREFFFDTPAIARVLDAVIDLGLGYVTLGQSTSSFSGGEAQRLKLLSLLKDNRDDKPAILIFDEPTTGLSDHDVHNLLKQLRALTAQGHTVIVVEHHLGVLKAADWLVEIGPDAADLGGELVFEGPPSGIQRSPRSLTAPFLYAAGNDKARAAAGRV